jgi:hypothetical protein
MSPNYIYIEKKHLINLRCKSTTVELSISFSGSLGTSTPHLLQPPKPSLRRPHPPPLLAPIEKRRSSQRSIKRKKFDDELVESSLIKSDRTKFKMDLKPEGIVPVETTVVPPPPPEKKKVRILNLSFVSFQCINMQKNITSTFCHQKMPNSYKTHMKTLCKCTEMIIQSNW